ncbi:MAG: adenylosuccinate lyase, partial [Paramuribaculum sp.]|nr:adenylosuccinate lyase [Paramuribaculum sp.]
IALSEIPLPALSRITDADKQRMRDIYQNFSIADAREIKEIESVTNHDVKAVEYFIKRRFDELGLGKEEEYVHFGLTSQDINNTAMPMALRESLNTLILPALDELTAALDARADEWKDIPMLAKTHGQPASPTRLGKEIRVFSYRLHTQIDALRKCVISGKFGGATGNFNAHLAAFPAIDWLAFANSFLPERLGIEREQWTTQISNYDNFAAVFQALERINTIMIDLDRDIWQYISMDYFKQKIKAGEVGSSAMPHKVNPIDFENSEGNLGIANAILAHLASKLPVSRLQRDLTDSTVLRNVGVPLGHTLIAIASTMKGLGKLILHEETIKADLDKMWSVVAEGIQTILRREEYPNPYETLKQLTRVNTGVTAESIAGFIDGLDVSESVKAELRALTPSTYTGY